MLQGLSALVNGLNNLRHQGYAYIWANALFIVLSLPIITLPAAFSALMRVGYTAHTQPHESDIGLMWETFRANLWQALPWGLAHLVFAVINFANLLAYGGEPGLTIAFLRFVWVGAGIMWIGVLLYTWPIYYAMENPTLLGATRNAFMMVVQNPFFTITIVAGIILLIILSTILVAAWMLLTFGAIAAIANAAVQNRLEEYRKTKIKGYGVH